MGKGGVSELSNSEHIIKALFTHVRCDITVRSCIIRTALSFSSYFYENKWVGLDYIDQNSYLGIFEIKSEIVCMCASHGSPYCVSIYAPYGYSMDIYNHHKQRCKSHMLCVITTNLWKLHTHDKMRKKKRFKKKERLYFTRPVWKMLVKVDLMLDQCTTETDSRCAVQL